MNSRWQEYEVLVESVFLTRLTAGFALAGLALTTDLTLTVGFTPTAGLEAAFAQPNAGLEVALIPAFPNSFSASVRKMPVCSLAFLSPEIQTES